jgi:predicted HicB family RNase H-like nuclease
LKYKGVEGKVRYNKDLKMFVGELHHIDDFIVFKGSTLKSAELNFKNAVETYLCSLSKKGKTQ